MRYGVQILCGYTIWPRPAVSLIRSSVGASEYSRAVLSKLFRAFMRFRGNNICPDERKNEWTTTNRTARQHNTFTDTVGEKNKKKKEGRYREVRMGRGGRLHSRIDWQTRFLSLYPIHKARTNGVGSLPSAVTRLLNKEWGPVPLVIFSVWHQGSEFPLVLKTLLFGRHELHLVCTKPVPFIAFGGPSATSSNSNMTNKEGQLKEHCKHLATAATAAMCEIWKRTDIQVRPSSGTDVYPHMPILRPHAARTW